MLDASKEEKVKDLLKKKEELLRTQRKLIDGIKRDYPEVYQWLLDHQIDIKNLKKYAAKIGIAFAVAASVFAHTGAFAKISPDDWPEPLEVLTTDELRGKDREERARLVWGRYGPFIQHVSEVYRVDPRLIFATIMVESMGNAYAFRYEPRINDASYGLGQTLYGTARLLGFEGRPEELYVPEVSIDLIGRYDRRNLDAYGDLPVEKLATAYNAGSPYNYPTYGYVEKITDWMKVAEEVVGG